MFREANAVGRLGLDHQESQAREFDDGEECQQHNQGSYRGFDHYRPLFFAGDAHR